jgi:hypothetical protein
VKSPFVSASLCFPLVGLEVLCNLLVTDDSVATIFALASPNSLVTEVLGQPCGRALFSASPSVALVTIATLNRFGWQNTAIFLTIPVIPKPNPFHFRTFLKPMFARDSPHWF